MTKEMTMTMIGEFWKLFHPTKTGTKVEPVSAPTPTELEHQRQENTNTNTNGKHKSDA